MVRYTQEGIGFMLSCPVRPCAFRVGMQEITPDLLKREGQICNAAVD